MRKIGIIGAMELEVETLQSKLADKTITERAGMAFHEGTLGGTPVVVVKCGIGKVNAALCVQILADLFQVTHVINTGIAGSLNAKLDIGDILISKDAVHHDMDVTIFGYQPGEVPQMGRLEFPADPAMMELAKKTCDEVCPDIHALCGRVVSGDQFISDSAVKDRLIQTFHGDCAEMEGASIAHGAYRNNLPFVILRAISDKADGSAEMDYPQFEKAAAENCAKLVEAMVAQM
ncbi:MAG: 5'-methylthioadenosine/adenosylhomocysteine nucleosidase [Lachnospiraceae bacterium]|nr:5'-methylthioadenosine/adenosylhomocysteine nucleosidase [Lachnospiraceae bacterium]